jgi:hypothetical protein
MTGWLTMHPPVKADIRGTLEIFLERILTKAYEALSLGNMAKGKKP